MHASAVLLLLLPALLCAQTLPPLPPEHILSTESPVTANLRANASLRNAVDPLHAIIRTLGGAIDKRVSSVSPLACNLRAVPWLLAARALFNATALGPLDNTCSTHISVSPAVLSGELSASAVSNAAAVIHKASDAFAVATGKFVGSFDMWGEDVEWPRGSFAVHGWDIKRGGQRCAVEAAGAFRVSSEWYIRAAVTNQAVDGFVADGQRVFVEEFVRQNLKPALQLQREKWGEEGTLLNGTTMLTLTGGKAEFGSVPMGVDENPAIKEALRLNEGAVDQAQDAITPSNIAILALPMAMSLIPVAFVADLNTCATLLYILLTDILSCLPFLIKGVELVHTGSARRGETVAYHIGTPALGLLEVWSASCHGDSSFRVLGLTFICVAVLAIGLLFEIVAAHVMRNRRRRRRGRKLRRGESIGPFGDALLVESRPDDFEIDTVSDGFDGSVDPSSCVAFVQKFGTRRRPDPALARNYDEPFPEPDDTSHFR